MQTRRFVSLLLAVGALGVLTLSVACREEPKLKPSQPGRQAAPALRLVVVGDPAIADAVRTLKGDWAARTGGTLEVIDKASDEFAAHEPLDADAVIYSADLLPELVVAGSIAPLPQELPADSELHWSDIFPVVQQGVASWGGEVWAVPLGAPVFTLLYRRDLFEKFERQPPTNWEEYQQLVRFFSDRTNLGELAPPTGEPWHGTLEPTAPGWAGRLLLARAAAYARHRDHFSTWFNIEDFSPLIAGPPFVRALEELQAAQNSTAGNDARLDAAGVREAFFAGQSAMALCWPTAAGPKHESIGTLRVGFAELPGSPRTFNFASHEWDQRTADESPQVPLVPVAGRVGSVVQDRPHAEAAWRLLSWLTGPTWGTRVGAASRDTTLDRRSQLDDAKSWLESGLDATAAKQYATSVKQALGHNVWAECLRIPGREQYLAALDEAVERALTREQTPAEALAAAAAAWREISATLGNETQKSAYRRSLGLAP